MKRILVAALVLGMTALVAGRHATSATLTDRVTSSNNTFGAATLAAPTALSASVGADGETVSLNWTNSASAFAAFTDIFHGTIAGTYPTAASPASVATPGHTSTDVPGRATTHYAVKARYQNWTSAFSTPDVSVAPIDHFTVSAPSTATTGTPINVTVTAIDTGGGNLANFTGSVALTGPAGMTCAAPGCTQNLVAGTKTFSVTFGSVPSPNPATITATYNSGAVGPMYTVAGSTTVTVNSASTTLKFNSPNSTTNTLVVGTAAGAREIDSANAPNFNSVTWRSASTVIVNSATGWAVDLTLGSPHASPAFSNAAFNIDVWVDLTSTCATAPTAATRIASVSNFAVNATGAWHIALTANGSFSTTGVARTLCVKVANSASSNGKSQDVLILAGTGGNSTITGVFN